MNEIHPIKMSDFSDLFYLGVLYERLEYGSKGRMVGSKYDEDKTTVLYLINEILYYLSVLNIHDKSLEDYLFETSLKLEDYSPIDSQIKDEDYEEIKTKLKGMWDHFADDLLKEKELILEVEDPLFNLKRLHEGITSFFDTKSMKKIPKGVVQDMEDAIKTILTGLWTPSVMITLRGVEGVLRNYYNKITGKNPIQTNGYFLNWNDILKELKQKGVKGEIMVNLEFLKERRNEAEHPDKRFDQYYAERTFLRAIDAINDML